MGEWQPIETAPKDGTLVLLWCIYDDKPEPAIARYIERQGSARLRFGPFVWRELDGGGIAERVPTHWCPLPPPPTDDAPQQQHSKST